MRSRPFRDPSDLGLMQALQSASAQHDKPLVGATPGDLAWWMYQHVNKLDEVRIRLWEDESGLAGWGWLWLPGTLSFGIRPDVHSASLLPELLS